VPATRTRRHRPGRSVHDQEWFRHLGDAGVGIGMDGKGRWIDNAFIERL
jgi:hypothetical protein